MEVIAVGDVVPFVVALSEVAQNSIITGVFALLMAIFKLHSDRLARKDARVALEELKSTKEEVLETKQEIKEISKDTKATHTFQNSQLGVALKGVAVATRAKAEIRKKNGEYDKADLIEAEAAEKAYDEHQQGQRRVDAQALITRAEEQARKLLEEQRERLGVKPQGSEPQTHKDVAEAVIEQLGKTHDIEGTVELTPKEPDKES